MMNQLDLETSAIMAAAAPQAALRALLHDFNSTNDDLQRNYWLGGNLTGEQINELMSSSDSDSEYETESAVMTSTVTPTHTSAIQDDSLNNAYPGIKFVAPDLTHAKVISGDIDGWTFGYQNISVVNGQIIVDETKKFPVTNLREHLYIHFATRVLSPYGGSHIIKNSPLSVGSFDTREGGRTDSGFKYLPELGISYQGKCNNDSFEDIKVHCIKYKNIDLLVKIVLKDNRIYFFHIDNGIDKSYFE
jgi:hypothetical protein